MTTIVWRLEIVGVPESISDIRGQIHIADDASSHELVVGAFSGAVFVVPTMESLLSAIDPGRRPSGPMHIEAVGGGTLIVNVASNCSATIRCQGVIVRVESVWSALCGFLQSTIDSLAPFRRFQEVNRVCDECARLSAAECGRGARRSKARRSR